jgi:putative toxin-antitoxin system antitoxin component (TIGR02293 family)
VGYVSVKRIVAEMPHFAMPAIWRYNFCQLTVFSEGLMEADIVETLGGARVFGRKKRIDLMGEVENGLPTKAYYILSDTLHLAPAEENRLLQVSPRTRARWRSQGKQRLEPDVSDRLVRIARVFALATEVLESREAAIEWLREKTPYLGDRSPLDALATDVGAEKVTNMLYQMEYGVIA